MYDNEIYEQTEKKAIERINDDLNTVKSGSEEDRRLCQSLTELLKVHDARVQAEREYETKIQADKLALEEKELERYRIELEDNRKRKDKWIDAGVTILKVTLVLGVNAMFIFTEYAWQNENTHLDALAREGRMELKKGFNNLFKKS